MSSVKKEDIEKIIQYLGKNENILSFGNCMTRLRISVKDTSVVEKEKIEELQIVSGVVLANEQIQIILGPGRASKGIEMMSEILGRSIDESEESDDLQTIANKNKSDMKKTQTSYIQQFLSKFAAIFTPLIPGFIAAGLLLGIATLLGQSIKTESESFQYFLSYLKIFSKAMFSFMSLLIGYNANKVFGGNGVNGAILAAFFILGYEPDTANKIYSGMQNFFGMEIDPRGNVIGVLIAAIISAWLEKRIRKFIPDSLEMILTSTITLLIMGVFTFIVIMPVGVYLFKGMSWLFTNLSGNPLGGAVLAGLFLISVMFGIHQGFVPIYFALVEEVGFNTLFPILAMAGAGQVGASLALYVKAHKNSKIRQQILGAIIPGILGIGEPLIYGVTLPRVKPFITACIGGSAGGLFIGTVAFLGFPIGLNTVFGPSGLVAAPLMTSNDGVFMAIVIYLLGILVSYITGFFTTLLFGVKNINLD